MQITIQIIISLSILIISLSVEVCGKSAPVGLDPNEDLEDPVEAAEKSRVLTRDRPPCSRDRAHSSQRRRCSDDQITSQLIPYCDGAHISLARA